MKMNSHEFSLDGGTFKILFWMSYFRPTFHQFSPLGDIFFGVHMCAMADLDLSHADRVYVCLCVYFYFFLGGGLCIYIYIYK